MHRAALATAAFLAGTLAAPFAQAKIGAEVAEALSSCLSFISNEEIGALTADIEHTVAPDARRFEVGRSVEGRPIWGLEMGCAARGEVGCPAARILGGLHGNECLSVAMVIALMERLVSESPNDDSGLLDALLANATLVFVPLVNPDGYSGVSATRENARGVDINRNFGFAWISEGTRPFSEPETRAVRASSDRYRFQIGLSYHTVARYINGPWNHTPHHPPEAALIEEMAGAYKGDSTYETAFGWDWYDIYGDLDDWSLGVWGTLNWTVELRSDRDLEFEVHAKGFDALMSYLFLGLRGTVVDAADGRSVSARIETDDGSSPVFTDSDGDFHKILLPGSYRIAVHAPSYAPKELDVEIEQDAVASVELGLERESATAPCHGFQVEQMTLGATIPRNLDTESYPNDTVAWAALGPPDGVAYSLTRGGSITLNFDSKIITDLPGDDLEVLSGTDSADPYAVFVAEDRDGPYVSLGEKIGTSRFDLEDAGLQSARYVRIVDRGDSPLSEDSPGFDLDAAVNLSPLESPLLPRVDGCGCSAGAKRSFQILNLLARLLAS